MQVVVDMGDSVIKKFSFPHHRLLSCYFQKNPSCMENMRIILEAASWNGPAHAD